MTMPDGTTSIAINAWEYLKGVVILILAILGWSVKRQIKRVDQIENNYVDKDTLNNAVLSLRNDFKAHATRMENGMTRTHERIDKLLDKK